ncbi:MAG: flagellar hook-basal body complex protein FliE [Aquabacterium sp.]|jgi:flagellar hook-basal body complex protein FliE|nr:MAG: flagellar hook-basal body complex protein FliE [Aquabacterium sp.]TAL13630.1 MAG: flagellar hook-basal body complex protein FliE [Aquabacterium sp.]
MSVEAIGFLPPALGALPQPAPQADPVAAAGGSGFGQWFTRELDAVNGKVGAAERGLQSLAAGDAPSLHQVMIDLEEARLGFQLVAQVRNRLLESYQEVMRMQI